MKRERAAEIINEVLKEDDEPWTAEQLQEFVAIGFNELGGGFGNRGLFFFKTPEEAERFVEAAPVSRSLAWLDDNNQLEFNLMDEE